jgi:hypothetical protein
MAERFGWTLEYIDDLPLAELQIFMQIEDGKSKAAQTMRNRKNG